MKKPFERWHPKIALRYLPIVKEIKKSGLENPQILEVGSGSLGIVPYLDLPVTGVDVDFSGPQFPLLKQVKGKATNLPFPDNSFDFAISVDVLEHLLPEKRAKAIAEVLRCAKVEVFMAVPCGKGAMEQDKELNSLYQQIFGQPFPFLKEHLTFGLPEKEWLSDTIKEEAAKLGKEVEIWTEGNINLSLRNFLMRGWMTKNIIIDFIFRKVFLLFIPIFRRMNREPTYRQIFFVKIIT